MRAVDLACHTCGKQLMDQMLNVDDVVTCSCGAAMEQIWWTRRSHAAQWDDQTAVMIHVNPQTGEVRYPGHHSAKLKPGFERQYLRSLREVERFERAHNVRSEMAWFDRGSGRGHDDEYRGERMTH